MMRRPVHPAFTPRPAASSLMGSTVGLAITAFTCTITWW